MLGGAFTTEGAISGPLVTPHSQLSLTVSGSPPVAAAADASPGQRRRPLHLPAPPLRSSSPGIRRQPGDPGAQGWRSAARGNGGSSCCPPVVLRSAEAGPPAWGPPAQVVPVDNGFCPPHPVQRPRAGADLATLDPWPSATQSGHGDTARFVTGSGSPQPPATCRVTGARDVAGAPPTSQGRGRWGRTGAPYGPRCAWRRLRRRHRPPAAGCACWSPDPSGSSA